MNKITLSVLSIGFFMLSQPSWAYKEIGKVLTPLEPVTKMTPLPVGTVIHELVNGKPLTRTVVAVTDDTISVERSDGCTYTDKMFGGTNLTVPSLKFSKCGPGNQYSDTQKVKLKKGKMFPLEKGAKWTYSAKGNNRAFSRSCKVKGTVRVKTNAGEFDTFKITCRQKKKHRKAYYAPAVGTVVAYDKGGNVTEWVKTVLP